MLPPQVSPNSSPRLLRTLHFLCSDGGRMLSLQDQRNPDVHDANSAWEWPLAVILETDTLCCTIFLPTSWIPRSRCMSQVKCCKGWLRWIASDRNAINPFFWAAFKLHQKTAFWCTSNDFCFLQFWDSSGRTRLHCADWRTSDSRLWRTPHASLSWHSSTRSQSRLDETVHVVRSSNVIDVLGEVVW